MIRNLHLFIKIATLLSNNNKSTKISNIEPDSFIYVQNFYFSLKPILSTLLKEMYFSIRHKLTKIASKIPTLPILIMPFVESMEIIKCFLPIKGWCQKPQNFNRSLKPQNFAAFIFCVSCSRVLFKGLFYTNFFKPIFTPFLPFS